MRTDGGVAPAKLIQQLAKRLIEAGLLKPGREQRGDALPQAAQALDQRCARLVDLLPRHNGLPLDDATGIFQRMDCQRDLLRGPVVDIASNAGTFRVDGGLPLRRTTLPATNNHCRGPAPMLKQQTLLW